MMRVNRAAGQNVNNLSEGEWVVDFRGALKGNWCGVKTAIGV